MMALYTRFVKSAADVQQLTAATATEKTTTATTVMTTIELTTIQLINKPNHQFINLLTYNQ